MDINTSNYEEFAMDYVDGTLNETDKAAMDAFLINHPEIQAELDGLDKIVLNPEDIRYERKALLLKKRKPIIMIPTSWYKMGAAAAIGGFMVFAGYKVLNNDTSSNVVPIQAQEAVQEVTPSAEESIVTEEVVVDQPLVAAVKQAPAKSKQVSTSPKVSEQAPSTSVVSTPPVVVTSPPANTVASLQDVTTESVKRQKVVIPEMPEIPAPDYDDAPLMAEVKSSPVQKVSIKQFDLNENLGVTNDANSSSPANDGFAIESFSASQKNTTTSPSNTAIEQGLTSDNGLSSPTMSTLDAEPSNSLLPKAFGIEIQKKKVLKPVKKKKQNN
ncbi:MAG: hypothetical protein KTR13_02330 [Saprospiraceae bacterium]|nr:hypothetical protein [Saprospiraceae bacterium]